VHAQAGAALHGLASCIYDKCLFIRLLRERGRGKDAERESAGCREAEMLFGEHGSHDDLSMTSLLWPRNRSEWSRRSVGLSPTGICLLARIANK
jgi:hypothetical protein